MNKLVLYLSSQAVVAFLSSHVPHRQWLVLSGLSSCCEAKNHIQNSLGHLHLSSGFDRCSLMMSLAEICSPESRGRPRVYQDGNSLERSRWERVPPKTPKPYSRSVHTSFILIVDVNLDQATWDSIHLIISS